MADRYVEMLHLAHSFEKGNRRLDAIATLQKAQRMTNDQGELEHLAVWKARLEREVANDPN